MPEQQYGTEPWILFSDFKAIAASVVKARIRSSDAQLTGQIMMELSILARSFSKCGDDECDQLRQRLSAIKDESLNSFRRELTRNSLITAIGILDFCLFEVLVFMIITRPDLLSASEGLPKRLPKRKAGEEISAYAKRAFRHTSIEGRLDLARDLLGVIVAPGLREDLDPLLAKRNDIAHHSKYYEIVPRGSAVAMEARAFPEVSFDEAMMVSIVVSEICDAILVSVAREFFHGDLGDLRPLNPSVGESRP